MVSPAEPKGTVSVVDDEPRLTQKQLDFAEHWLRLRNAQQAYKLSYSWENMSPGAVTVEATRMLSHPKIALYIKQRRALLAQNASADSAWLLERFLQIATADPRELIGLKVGCCRYCYGEGHGYHWRDREYLEAVEKVEREARLYPERAVHLVWPDPAGGFGFNATWPPVPNCPQCHGEGVERAVPRDTDRLSEQAALLYGGVKVKPNGGYEIIIADRAKAAELAGRILGAFKDGIKLSGAIGHFHAVADLRKIDPQEAANVYREFVAGYLT